ncbi:hypothetical protein GJ496_011344 [Pomphorhynchus laevis]|nr:hypothetical protein GJ496_011344 [Pomphorhynchus laevis]
MASNGYQNQEFLSNQLEKKEETEEEIQDKSRLDKICQQSFNSSKKTTVHLSRVHDKMHISRTQQFENGNRRTNKGSERTNMTLPEKPVSQSRHDLRRAAVLERKRKQEEELKAKLESMKIEQQRKYERVANAKQQEKALKNYQCANNQPSKQKTLTNCKQLSTKGSIRGQQHLPQRIQQVIDRLYAPKYRKLTNDIEGKDSGHCNDRKDKSNLMTQSIHGCLPSITKKTSKEKNLNSKKLTVTTDQTHAMSRSLNFSKSPASKCTKVQQTKENPQVLNKDSKISETNQNVDGKLEKEIEYKRKLEEIRRVAREKQDEERLKIENERKEREEKEIQAELEVIRLQQESKRLENERLLAAIKLREEMENQLKLQEEEEREQKAQSEKFRAEEHRRIEIQRQLRLYEEEQSRQERKKKLNNIMSAHRSQTILTPDKSKMLKEENESMSILLNSDLISSKTSEVVKSYLSRACTYTDEKDNRNGHKDITCNDFKTNLSDEVVVMVDTSPNGCITNGFDNKQSSAKLDE